jgi:hypothetical protein
MANSNSNSNKVRDLVDVEPASTSSSLPEEEIYDSRYTKRCVIISLVIVGAIIVFSVTISVTLALVRSTGESPYSRFKS